LGIGNIIAVTGSGLVLLGGRRLSDAQLPKILPAGLALWAASALALSTSGGGRPRCRLRRGRLYEKILILDVPFAAAARASCCKTAMSAAAWFWTTSSMAFDYTRYFDLYRLFVPNEDHLAIGGGAYSVPGHPARLPPRSWTCRDPIRRCMRWRSAISTFRRRGD